MSKMDYDAYLKTLGTVNVDQLEIIKEYLEKQCQTDEALRAVYNPEKIKDCYDFIVNCARKSTTDNRACLKSEVVFKMARDYFIEILPSIPETTDDQSEQKAKTENKKAEKKNKTEQKAKTENKKAEKKNKTEQKAEEKPVDVAPVQEAVKEVCEQIETDAAADKEKRDYCGFEVFGEEADEPEEAEKAAPEPCHQDEVGETAEAPEIKAPEPNEEDDVFLSGQAFNAGDIIDKHGRRIFFKDLMPGMRFVRADDPDSLQYMVVCVVKNIKENRFSYDNNEHDISWYSYDSKDYFDSDTSKCGGFGYAVPGDAMIIGKIEKGERKLFEEAVAATADYDTEGNGLLFGF